MSGRFEVAESAYANLLSSVPGVVQAKAGSHAGRLNLTAWPAWAVFVDRVDYRRTTVATAQSLKTIKAVVFVGVFVVKAGDVDSARLVAYPIIDASRAALSGFQVNYDAHPTSRYEMVGPTTVKGEDVITLEVGLYGYMMEWEFEMSFSKGVA